MSTIRGWRSKPRPTHFMAITTKVILRQRMSGARLQAEEARHHRQGRSVDCPPCITVPNRFLRKPHQREYRRPSDRDTGLLCVMFLATLWCTSHASAQISTRHSTHSPSSVPTELRVVSVPWWPTKGSPGRDEYAGSAACTKCHAEKAASQTVTSMGRAAVRASDAEPLKNHPELSFSLTPYAYQLVTKNG